MTTHLRPQNENASPGYVAWVVLDSVVYLPNRKCTSCLLDTSFTNFKNVFSFAKGNNLLIAQKLLDCARKSLANW
jgi:hypothetical protein